MTQPKKYSSKQQRGGSRWAVKVLGALAVPVIVGGAVLLRSGSEVPARSKAATNVAYARKETRPTLSPARFVGKAARAHEIAQEIPDVLDQLHCYCECEKHMRHTGLLSCYTDGHAGT